MNLRLVPNMPHQEFPALSNKYSISLDPKSISAEAFDARIAFLKLTLNEQGIKVYDYKPISKYEFLVDTNCGKKRAQIFLNKDQAQKQLQFYNICTQNEIFCPMNSHFFESVGSLSLIISDAYRNFDSNTDIKSAFNLGKELARLHTIKIEPNDEAKFKNAYSSLRTQWNSYGQKFLKGKENATLIYQQFIINLHEITSLPQQSFLHGRPSLPNTGNYRYRPILTNPDPAIGHSLLDLAHAIIVTDDKRLRSSILMGYRLLNEVPTDSELLNKAIFIIQNQLAVESHVEQTISRSPLSKFNFEH